jgi:hypothetical protein
MGRHDAPRRPGWLASLAITAEGDVPGLSSRKCSKFSKKFDVSMAASRPLAWLDVKRLGALCAPFDTQGLVVC